MKAALLEAYRQPPRVEEVPTPGPEAGRITGEVEQAPLTAINEVFERLEHGDVAGRAVLNP